jgi:hypothetical protein
MLYTIPAGRNDRPAVRRPVVVDTGRRSVDRVGYIYIRSAEVKHVVPNAVRIPPPTYDRCKPVHQQAVFISFVRLFL